MGSKKKARRKGAQCKCIDKVNQALANKHPSLELQVGMTAFQVPSGKTGHRVEFAQICVIPVKKKEFSERVPAKLNIRTVTANYCPFCGKKYDLGK